MEVNLEVFRPKQRLQVTGPKLRDDIFALHHGKLCQVLVELTATGFYCLFHRSPLDLSNKTVALESLIGREKNQSVCSNLASSDDPFAHIAIIQRFIASLDYMKVNNFSYLETSIRIIEESNGNISVNEICQQTHISERQLNRKFVEVTGLKPIQFIKLKQLHYVINLLQSRKFSSMKELAYETGFYDSAHFHNHFRKLTGMSPGAFLVSEEHVAFKYYNDLIEE